MPGASFPKPSSRNKRVWVLYNAWRPCGPEITDKGEAGRLSEAGVTEEVNALAGAIESLGFSPELYALSSVVDFAIRMTAERPDIVFNLCEGFRGLSSREFHAAALLELFDIPCTGNSAKTLCLAQDKILCKRLFASRNIPTPAWAVFDGGVFPAMPGLRFPLIVKPSREDASIGIESESVQGGRAGLEAAVRRLFADYRQPVLLEEFIEGREINAAVVVEDGEPRVLPLSEIRFDGLPPGAPHITSYAVKWLPDSPWYTGTPTLCPAPLEGGLREKIESLSIAVFELLGGRDYGRIDFRLDADGRPWVLEFNPNPDISPSGGFVRSLAAAGRDLRDFAALLLRNARRE